MSPKGAGLLKYLQTLCFLSSCTADMCNWSGSGLAGSTHSGLVQQVRLRCSAGFVTWFSPCHALRVMLQPNVWSTHHATVCIKALVGFQGATVYLERSKQLDLLLQDGQSPELVHCFRTGVHNAAIFLQANPPGQMGPNVVAFRYELLQRNTSAAKLQTTETQAACRPCSDLELLKAICNSDFVVRGSIRNVSHDSEHQISVVEVEEGRVFRQRSGVFERDPDLLGYWRGNVHTLLRCGVKAGAGQFLFTGAELFGEAWLGCAPRFKDFQTLYHSARKAQRIPCDFVLD